jgi:hypothetical protein
MRPLVLYGIKIDHAGEFLHVQFCTDKRLPVLLSLTGGAAGVPLGRAGVKCHVNFLSASTSRSSGECGV